MCVQMLKGYIKLTIFHYIFFLTRLKISVFLTLMMFFCWNPGKLFEKVVWITSLLFEFPLAEGGGGAGVGIFLRNLDLRVVWKIWIETNCNFFNKVFFIELTSKAFFSFWGLSNISISNWSNPALHPRLSILAINMLPWWFSCPSPNELFFKTALSLLCEARAERWFWSIPDSA